MWSLAFAVFFACKGLTWVDAVGAGGFRRRLAGQARGGRVLAYFMAWPGMDPVAFFLRARALPIPWKRLVLPFARIAGGAALVWGVVPHIDHPLPAGWVGMIGLVLMFHFGVFDLLGALWRMRGVTAPPLMNAPIRATGLANFWGKRWNTAFHQLSHRYVFKPVRRQLGATGAMLTTFLASGVVHDLVISVPAGAGYGLPTAYFLIQGLGVLIEKSWLGPVAKHSNVLRNVGMFSQAEPSVIPRHDGGFSGETHRTNGRSSWRDVGRRAFAWVVVVAPLPLLFHQAFVLRVILPFLEVIR
jgi:alginate O-acetyltransferase complex protein AlgI